MISTIIDRFGLNKIILATIIASIFWIGLVSASYSWNFHNDKESNFELARQYDRALIAKDMLYYRWNAKYGGIYVVSESTTENKLKGRANGVLIKINPPDMIRSVYKIEKNDKDIIGHFMGTSYGNSSDPIKQWEVRAIAQFNKGVEELSEIQYIDHKEYMSLLQPLKIEQDCLQCHNNSKNKIGDIVGAISASVPMDFLFNRMDRSELDLLFGHLIIGLFGLLFIIYGGKRINHSFSLLQGSEINLKSLVEDVSASRDIIEDNLHQNNILVEKLNRSNNRLKTALKTRHKFFSIIAHDMRSPFASLLSYSNFLVEDYNEITEDDRLKYISNINNALKNLYELVNNLLTWSQFQLHNTNFHPQKVKLSDIIRTVVNTLQISAMRKEITLEPGCPVSISIYVDKNMIETVIRNLVSNAIKFSPANSVIKIETEENTDFLSVIVKDSGIGMDDETVKQLFNQDSYNTRRGTSNEKGVGLGLMICKEFVETHGGKISVISKVDEGTTVSFTLPHNNSDKG